jgi:malonyl-CoA O-methyltransferase
LKARSASIDARAARRRFERSANTYAEASRLEAEVAARMLERLGYLRLAAQRILDAGSGTSREAAGLRQRFRGARIIALDFALGMLQQARKRRGLLPLRSPVLPVCGDLARLPLADGSIDLAWCNMALHWAADPALVIRELSRVLAPEGLLIFSALGPDSLKELSAVAGKARVHEFIDMHDLGDLLVAAGLAAPVMEMEMLHIRYADAGALLADLRRSGQTSARTDRPRGLSGRGFAQRLRAGLSPDAGVPFTATFELVYGHAWKAPPRAAQEGRGIVQFHPRSLR